MSHSSSGLHVVAVAMVVLVAGCGDAAGAPDAGLDLGATADLGDADAPVDAPVADALDTDLGQDFGTPDAGCETDADGDGSRSIECAGDDCDDTDPNRYPGNTETCDSGGRDEDCDPTTFGPDRDADGFISATCCNRQLDGTLFCGFDCDDTTMDVSPVAPEVCDGLDDDCDGTIDEGVQLTFYRDVDGDRYGSSTMTRQGCSAPAGYALLEADCDDSDSAVHPGASDTCNAIDDNCDGTIDESCPCTSGATQACGVSDGMGGFLTRGICVPGMQACVTGTWGACMGNVNPVPESCNSLDDNCNGMIDDGVLTDYYRDCDRDGYGAAATTPTAGCAEPGLPPACASGTGAWVANDTDCDDAIAATHPAALETCNRVDDNCDTIVDGAPATTWCNGPGLPPRTTTAVCASAVPACVPTACATGFLDCSGAPGCESETVDPSNCGACGRVCAWGRCDAGVCDDPVQLAVGGSQRCVRRASGRVVCWGANFYGQLGDGAALSGTTESLAPVTVVGLTDAVDITTGGQHSCARRSSGAVVCWGANSHGQLGDGTTSNRSTPAAVMGLSDAVQIEGGAYHTCARRSSGAVVCWGDNTLGQLGDGTTTDRTAPTPVMGLTDAIDIGAGFGFTCAVRATGQVVCWGLNNMFELGDGASHTTTCVISEGFVTADCSLVPVTVAGLSDAVEVSAGGGDEYALTGVGGHACARRASGAVVCWGRNREAQCGNGVAGGTCGLLFQQMALPVAGLADAVEISVSESGEAGHACARRATGTVSCWGNNSEGAVGPSTGASAVCDPMTVSGLSDAVEIGMGATTRGAFVSRFGVSCARRASGAVVCWGDGYGATPSVVPPPL